MIKDNILFIREGLDRIKDTGAIFPTSKWAAKAMCSTLKGPRTPKKILELGPGSGSVTVKILEEMIDGDELSICEINPRFMKMLRERLEKLPEYQHHKKNIEFHLCPAQELPETKKFDVIVCALPFLNFDFTTVEEIFAKIARLSVKDTVMTYYEYMGLRHLNKVISSPERKEHMRALEMFYKEHLHRNYLQNRTPVWLNVLPIHVYELRMAV